jgi:hypothetical protein
MSYDHRYASGEPKPMFAPGDEVNVMSDNRVLFTGKIFRRVQYDDFQGCWTYKVKDNKGGSARTFNETSIQPAQAAPSVAPPRNILDDHEGMANRLAVRLEQEMNKIVRGAGKVTEVQTEGPGSGWLVVFDTEYAALKAYYHYRHNKPNFGKANGGGWFVSVH